MENATKGLMIAGAILIAIVLIGIGVMLVGQAQGWIGKSSQVFDDQTVQSFNSKYEAYVGTRKGAEVSTLLRNVISNNLRAIQDGTDDQETINIVYGNGSPVNKQDDILAILNDHTKVNTGRSYTVTVHYADNRLVDVITVVPI